MNGLRILHISDLHASPTRRFDMKLLDEAAEARFDLCALTGDMVLNEPEDLLPFLPYIKKLVRRAPVVYVQGNHELLYFDEMKLLLEGVGALAADNECHILNIPLGRVSVIGIRDYYYLKDSRFRGIEKLFCDRDKRFNILLSHQPQIFDYIEKKGYTLGLVLCGHTHGGQVRLPFLPALYAPGQGILPKYGDGLFTGKSNIMYVSRGVGATHFPLRLFNEPEISLLTLYAAMSKPDGRALMREESPSSAGQGAW